MEKLSNGILTIEVSSHGAELSSLKCGDTEYLWQADPAYWKRHSPVLFPIVGSLWNGKCRIGGKEFEMSQHGFARDMDFTLVSKTDNELWYRLVSDESTMRKYPFPFRLEIGYRIEGRKVEVMWSVSNSGEEEMYFQIGAHPAFYYPDYAPDTEKRGFVRLEGSGQKAGQKEYCLIKEKGCADPSVKYASPDLIPIDIHTFDRDALIFEDGQVSKVTLLTNGMKEWLSLSFDAPLVGLWSPPAKNAPFVCIEPWYGRCDRAGFEGEFRDRDWVQHLGPGETFKASYIIEVC